jgi:hypothetical protein
MYLTAQRVRSPTGVEGINAFRYVHGAVVWQGLPPSGLPDEDPGTLVAQSIAVPPPGNRVRSYLDVVAPDGTPWDEILPALMTVVSEAQRGAIPWAGIAGRCFFRVSMDREIAAHWQRELGELCRAVESAVVSG